MPPEETPRLYKDLANWWPLFSPPSHYVEEAADLLPSLLGTPDSTPHTLLELGCGGGSLASHFKAHLKLTLSDRSPEMLRVSQAVNPECEHVLGDMRILDLRRQFDVVLVHDAIMYATSPQSVCETLATAHHHCRAGGAVVVVPDWVRETFEPETESGGEDGADGSGLRYLRWTWDPDPSDHTYDVAFAFLLREPNGSLRLESDRHQFGLFPRASWLGWLEATGFAPPVRTGPWGRDIFLAQRLRQG